MALMEKAAGQGHAYAMNELGHIHYERQKLEQTGSLTGGAPPVLEGQSGTVSLLVGSSTENAETYASCAGLLLLQPSADTHRGKLRLR